VDTTFAAGASVPARIVVTGSEGAIENVGDVRVVLRRPGEAPEQFDFEPEPGDGHHQAMVAWAGAVRDAVTGGSQITPSFVDGVACMRVMEQWRARPPAGPDGTG
jgi:hypothetical protein